MMSELYKIRNCLTSIKDLPVYHYWRPKLEPPFCIWQEDGEGNSLNTNNHKTTQVITGAIDYYTLNEYDDNVEKIQEALNNLEHCGWRLNGVDYEDETNLIHYTWSFQII